MSGSVLERSVLPAGKVFIEAGEANMRAYLIQNGEVIAYKGKGDDRIEVARYGAGALIGEMNLMMDETPSMSYETVEATTVVTITRQDFQKKLARADKSITTILEFAVKKIVDLENEIHHMQVQKAKEEASAKAKADAEARSAALAADNEPDTVNIPSFMDMILDGLSDDERTKYENALRPHLTGMLTEVQKLKAK